MTPEDPGKNNRPSALRNCLSEEIVKFWKLQESIFSKFGNAMCCGCLWAAVYN